MFGNLGSFYLSVAQLDFYLSELKSAVITTKNFLGVSEGTFWCPKIKEVKRMIVKTVK
jgi:hypothetical protein